MKRIIKVLVVSALMVVLMATTVSPAFAVPKSSDDKWGWGDGTPQGYGYPVRQENGGCEDPYKPKRQGWSAGNCEYPPQY